LSALFGNHSVVLDPMRKTGFFGAKIRLYGPTFVEVREVYSTCEVIPELPSKLIC
jgi:hypothetical protein